MIDLATTIEPKSDQLNADDLIGRTLTIQITKVSKGNTGEQPIDIHFQGDNHKPYKPCKSMRRVMVQVWGRDGAAYVGRSMTIYRDDSVKWGGAEVGGIRISHMSDIDREMTFALTASKTVRKPFTVKPLKTEKVVAADPMVKAAGDEAAEGGVDVYTAWLASLAPDVKATVKPYHARWSAIAKAVVIPDSDEIAFDATDEPADFVDPTILDPPTDDDGLDTETENLRAIVEELMSALPKQQQKDLLVGKPSVGKMDKGQLEALHEILDKETT